MCNNKRKTGDKMGTFSKLQEKTKEIDKEGTHKGYYYKVSDEL